ncbi:MAG TPA: hypothetical protein VJR47_05070 [Stellaceae bacterium]|nr:hypothetical protein [Stellaceae bacterium]
MPLFAPNPMPKIAKIGIRIVQRWRLVHSGLSVLARPTAKSTRQILPNAANSAGLRRVAYCRAFVPSRALDRSRPANIRANAAARLSRDYRAQSTLHWKLTVFV